MPHCNKKMISFFLTTKCNLCCRYCYNANERNSIKEQSLPIEIAKAGIDWYFKNNKSRHIRFYGPGEPTQEYDLLREITLYAKSHPDSEDRVTVEIQTNGVFTENIREWMLNNLNIVWMSFDGMKDIQSYNRPLNPLYKELFNNRSSADVLEDNVRWLISNKGTRNLMVGARVTITDLNADRQIEMVDYFSDMGIQYVWTNPLFYSVGKNPVCEDDEKRNAYHFNMERYIEHYLKAYNYANTKGVFWGSFLTINFDGESAYHCRSCTPMEAPHITPDGYISACDMVVLGAEPYHMKPFIVGKWDPNLKCFEWDKDKVQILNNRKSTRINHCMSCPAQLHCGGYCLGEIVNETGDLDGQNAIKCKTIRRLYTELGQCEPYPFLHP